MLTGTIWSLPYYTTLSSLDLGWGVIWSVKRKTFSTCSGWNMIKFWKEFKLNILILLLSVNYADKGNNCCFTDCVWKFKYCAFRHLWTSFVQAWFGIRSYWPMHFITSLSELDFDSRPQRYETLKSSVLIIYLTKFSMEFWHVVETCWSDQSHIHCISFSQYFKGENPA